MNVAHITAQSLMALVIVVSLSPILALGAIRQRKQGRRTSRVVISVCTIPPGCRPVHDPEPAYPAMARAARVEGVVRVQALVDPAGKVIRATAVAGHPLLRSAAVEAALKWQFDRCLLDQYAAFFRRGTRAYLATDISFRFSREPTSTTGLPN